MPAIPTRIFRELMPLFELIPLLNACKILRMVLRLKEHSISSPTLSSQTCWVLCSTWKMHNFSCLLTLSDASLGEFSYRAPSPQKKMGGGGCGTLWQGPLGGPSLPHPQKKRPPPPKKKRRGKRSRKEITYDPEGCFLDGCLSDYVAFCRCSSDYSHFDFW